MPTIDRDHQADALYIQLDHQRTINHTVELTPDILIDVAEDDTVVGIDIQHFSQLVKEGPQAPGTTPTHRLTISENPPVT